MSDYNYTISKIYPSDKRSQRQVDALLEAEGIRRDANLDYTCGMYDEDMNLIAYDLEWAGRNRSRLVDTFLHEVRGEP